MSSEIEHEIRTLLDKHSVKIFLRETSDRERTKNIKDTLCTLGRKHDFRVAAGGCDAEDAEWLYDMVWMKLSDDKSLLRHQAMVMECEWRMGIPVHQSANVDLDFQKLVQARADIRVWICTVPNRMFASSHIENCEKQIEAFSGTMGDDHYLFVVHIWDGNYCEIKPYRALRRPQVQPGVAVPAQAS